VVLRDFASGGAQWHVIRPASRLWPSRPGAFGLQRLQAENGREIFTGKVLGTFNFGGILPPTFLSHLFSHIDVSQILTPYFVVLQRNATPPSRGG
jgi:hypothetical protein